MLTGFCLTFSTPLCCAMFPQKASILNQDLEASLQHVSIVLVMWCDVMGWDVMGCGIV